jgi:hypothetical protein
LVRNCIRCLDALGSSDRPEQGNAPLNIELKDATGIKPIDLYFGLTASAGHEAHGSKTIPDKGWFAYIRIYGPEQAAFDGGWKPGDFEKVND